jgi:hypothetical protein
MCCVRSGSSRSRPPTGYSGRSRRTCPCGTLGDRICGARRGTFAESLDRISAAIGALLKARAEAGVLRSESTPLDVGFSLGGILLITTDKGLRDGAGRMLDLLLDGLRHRAV